MLVAMTCAAAEQNPDGLSNLEARRLLTQATILQRSGKAPQAVALLHERFPNGPPSGDLAVAYYKIIGSTPAGWSEARLGLEALIKSDPKNLPYQLALISLLGSRMETRDEAFKSLNRLARVRKIDKQRLLQTWREVLNAQKSGEDLIPYYQDYLSVDPQNQEISTLWKAQKDAQAERYQIAKDPLLRRRQLGLDLLEQGDFKGAEPPLMDTIKALPKDYLALGAMGKIRMRQGRYEEAIAYYEKALALNPSNSGKWASLIATSKYWLQIHRAEEARDKQEYARAQEQIKLAIELDPQSSDAIAVSGTIEADQGNVKAAAKQYKEALTLEPDNGIAIRGLVKLLIGEQKWTEAMVLVNQLTQASGDDSNRYNYLRIQILSGQADAYIAAGDNAAAIPCLVNALKLDPASPWLRYQLAGIYDRSGAYEKGLTLMQDGLKRAPSSSEMNNAYALFLLNAGKTKEAISFIRIAMNRPGGISLSLRLSYASALNQLGEDDELSTALAQLKKMHLTGEDLVRLKRIEVDYIVRKALAAGDSNKAMVYLQQAIALDEDDVWLRLDLARLYAKANQPQEGITLFTRFLKAHPGDAEGLYAYALYLSGIRDYLSALNTLDQIPAAQRSEKMLRSQRRIWMSLQLVQVDYLFERKQKELAANKLTELQNQIGTDPDLSEMVAFAWYSMDEQAKADAIFAKIEGQQEPLSIEWHLQYANYLVNTNQQIGYQKELDYLAAQKLDAIQTRDLADIKEAAILRLADRLIRSDEIQAAKEALQPLLELYPDNYKVLNLESHILRREGDLDRAITLEQQSLAQWPPPLELPHSLSTLAPAAKGTSDLAPNVSVFHIEPPISTLSAVSSGDAYQYRLLANMLDDRTNWLSGAANYLSLKGTPGESSYSASEVPLEWRMPLGGDQRLTLRADQVNINAGAVSASNANTFGTMALCQTPACYAALTNQSATGTALDMGYEKQGFKADIGTTPLGFLVQNWIGGIKQKGDLGPLGYSIEAFRRPMTSTLLSYAGTRDPYTGNIWGGMVATGGSLGLSLDQGETWGGWANFRARSLNGTNVESNSDTQFMTGLTLRLINEPDRMLSTGLTGMLWAFKKNAGEFTYGQGGYYSPQSYQSLTIPLNYSERMERFSYVIGGSVSSSYSRTDSAPYFPTNAAYQAAAGNPYYSASSGPGTAYSFLAAWEYQLSPSVFVGNSLKLERSPYYAPNTFIVYFRIALDHVASQPVPLRVQPVIPTSQF